MNRVIAHRRRGVLLLVVLSMLTLFLMLGATYLVAATRARRLAKAYAAAASSQADTEAAATSLVDEAFLTVIRGTTVASGTIRTGDTLLGDRYGDQAPEKGRITSVTGNAILGAAVTGLGDVEKLAGRVLTFTMPDLGGASTRIIRAESNGGATTIYFPAGRTASGFTLTAATINQAVSNTPSAQPHVLVNNREFDGSSQNEPYDATDLQNAFLATVTGTSATASFNATKEIDNDADGIADSGWLDIGLPPTVDASGNVLQPKAAILIVDLDGRINVNAHGTNVDLESTETTTAFGGGGSVDYYPNELLRDPNDPTGNTITGTIPLRRLPRGLGLGPAEASVEATSVLGTSAGDLPLLLSGMPTIGKPDTSANSRPRPLIGGPEGRYGDAPLGSMTPAMLAVASKPGAPQVDDNRTIDQWVSSSTPSNSVRFFDDTASRYGSPPDIKGRMRLWVDAFGQPIYFKPAWNANTIRSFADDEIVDDPYELDLGPTGPRNGWIHDPATFASGASPATDNLFTPAELEGVLRFYDPDTLRLPRRLVTLLGSSADQARLHVTTESWDTSAVVGSKWSEVIAAQFAAATTNSSGTNGAKPYQLFAPEILMGHRLDLNRPFHNYDGLSPQTWEPFDEDMNSNGTLDSGEDRNGNGTLDNDGELARQQFAKHVYCLLVAIAVKNKGAPLTPLQAEHLAQWAVNVVDFRDADSIMTRFDYDESFKAGSTTWSPTKRVWGCERPEILITETHAWHDRRTDDTAAEPNGKEVIHSDASTADNDFDQRRRPRGAFFIELHSPWGSQAKQSLSGTTPYDVHRSGTNTPRMRGEPLPAELTALGDDRFDRAASITLSLRHDRSISNSDTATASPIWRLVSVRGDVQAKGSAAFGSDAFGDDPGRPYVSGAVSSGTSILDPARPRGVTNTGTNPVTGLPTVGSGTAVIDRIFYFTPPPPAQRAEANGYGQQGCVFWESGTSQKEPSQRDFVVFGTDNLSPTDVSVTGTFPNVHRTFNRPVNRPATLSEPLATGTATTTTGTTSADGYQALTGTAPLFASGTGIYDPAYTLNTTLDAPLDARTSHPATVTGPFLDTDGHPVLMQNGRHANFAIVHLQRLADPSRAWQPDDTQPFYNPYLTVDSMPVDLTVVNTGTSNSVSGNYDEPGRTPQDTNGTPIGDALTWLANQKEYDRWSVERGGKTADNAALERDLWNSKVNVAPAIGGLTVKSEQLFRSGTAADRPISNYTPPPQPNPGNQRGSISKTDLPSPLPSSSFGALPERFQGQRRQPWLFWPNRPFTSPAELAAVPRASSFHLLKLHTTGTASSTASPPFAHLTGLLESVPPQEPWSYVFSPSASGTAAPPSIFDFVHVPTRFTGSYVTVSATNGTVISELQNNGLHVHSYNHFSLFREPGRVNVNTTPDDTFKTALLGKEERATPPTWSSGTAVSWIDALKSVNASFVDATKPHRNSDLDVFFRYQTADRLANTATTRSNVFAVWVTVGYFSNGNTEAQPVRRQRGFFIFDRSIPVGFEPGHDHNVRDGILLRRIIQ